MNECVIYEETQPVGQLQWRSDGLRWHFQAKLRQHEGIRYLWLADEAGAQLRLGVPQPAADGMGLVRTLTRQGLNGLCPERLCRAQLCSSDALPEIQAAAGETVVGGEPAANEAQTRETGSENTPECLTVIVYRENGRLYVGEPFEVGKELIFCLAFQKMVFREMEGRLHWLLEIG